MRHLGTVVAVGAWLAAAGVSYGGIQASATYTSKPGTTDTYEYDFTLHNTGTTNISVFWYAWDHSNVNFLPFVPDNLQAPANWYPLTTYNYNPAQGYEYGVEWYALGSPLAPGQSLSGFSFESDEPPAFFASLSAASPTFPVSTSWAYMAYPAQSGTDTGFEFVPAQVPEPASLGILALGAVGILRRRRRTFASSSATCVCGAADER